MTAEKDPGRMVGGFPVTRHSAIVALKEGRAQERRVALEQIISAYWAPVYKYLRLHWRRDAASAEDLTQGFFLAALEKDFLADFDPAKARFRTFLRVCLDRFVGKHDQAASRQKRGGNSEHLSLDFNFVEHEIKNLALQKTVSPEELFEREWVRGLFTQCVDELRRDCEAKDKSVQFAIFEAYDLQSLDSDEKVSYQSLAAKHDIKIETVTNYLAAMRREFRAIVLRRIRELTANEEEYRAEVRAVLGIDPS